jgi:hypothetical protein
MSSMNIKYILTIVTLFILGCISFAQAQLTPFAPIIIQSGANMEVRFTAFQTVLHTAPPVFE